MVKMVFHGKKQPLGKWCQMCTGNGVRVCVHVYVCVVCMCMFIFVVCKYVQCVWCTLESEVKEDRGRSSHLH